MIRAEKMAAERPLRRIWEELGHSFQPRATGEELAILQAAQL